MELKLTVTTVAEARAGVAMLQTFIAEHDLQGPGVAAEINELFEHGLTVFTFNILREHRIDTIAEALTKGRNDFLKLPRMGKKSAQNVLEALENWKQAQAEPEFKK